MPIFFLASLSSLFPSLALPLAVGWKQVQVFDLLFLSCLGFAALKRALQVPDWRLITAATALIAAGCLALLAHPSPGGVRSVSSVAYSAVVLVAISHVRLESLGVRADRVIIASLSIVVGLEWAVFLGENLFGVTGLQIQSAALPESVHRFGALTGANALILFLCLAAPLVRTSGGTLVLVLLPGLATLSRSIIGVGIAVIGKARALQSSPGRTHPVVLIAAWLGVGLGLFAYAFAVVPLDPSERAPLRLSLSPGGYLIPHLAALRMVRSHPTVGVGPARFAPEYRNFTSPKERALLAGGGPVSREPHSAILGVAAEQGLLGLAALGWLFYEVYRRLARTPDPELRSAFLAGLTGLLVGGLFVDWLALKGLWLWIGLMVASSVDATSSFGEGEPEAGADAGPI